VTAPGQLLSGPVASYRNFADTSHLQHFADVHHHSAGVRSCIEPDGIEPDGIEPDGIEPDGIGLRSGLAPLFNAMSGNAVSDTAMSECEFARLDEGHGMEQAAGNGTCRPAFLRTTDSALPILCITDFLYYRFSAVATRCVKDSLYR